MYPQGHTNHLGGIHSRLTNALATQIWKWCIDRQIGLTAEHLLGKMNQVADTESWTVHNPCDWMLHLGLFALIQEVVGPVEIDLFASWSTSMLLQLELIPTSDSDTGQHSNISDSGRVYNAGGSSAVGCLATIRNCGRMRGLSEGASTLLESAWRDKTKSTYIWLQTVGLLV